MIKRISRYLFLFGVAGVAFYLVHVILGGITAFLFANKLPYFGLFERINVGVLQTWTAS